jgi:glucose-1-phosphate adenylyltransferase
METGPLWKNVASGLRDPSIRIPVDSTLTVILGGGRGTRLYPLTEQRSKPAVPLGGKYRIIDIPISNCINSHLRRIFVLTQFNSASLNRHVNISYRFDVFSRGFVEVLAAEQTQRYSDWQQGTADAVRRQIRHFSRWSPSHYLILAGDQLYRMDFRELLAHHVASRAQITICGLPVARDAVGSLGIVEMDPELRLRRIVEKPDDPSALASLKISPETCSRIGLEPSQERFLASMGIYVFDAECLEALLSDPEGSDFARHILPRAMERYKVNGHVHHGYWEDIGTIRSFFQANLMLTQMFPPFDFYNSLATIYTNNRYLAPSKFYSARITNSIVSEGCIVEDATVEQSVVGVRSMIQRGVHMARTVMIGADTYDPPSRSGSGQGPGSPRRGIGKGARVVGAIIDKNACIGEEAVIENRDHVENADGDGYAIREGIVIVKRDAIIQPGTVI